MDPTAVLKSVWRYRWYVLPAVLITIGVALFMFALGPRTYESTVSYALVNPDVPTEADIERDPALAQLNGDNPYLRSTDPNLVANVVITRLNAAATGEYLEGIGLSSDYEVSPGVGGSGFIVQITAVGSTRTQSLETSNALGGMFESELLAIQSVNGADPRFFFTSIVVAQPDRAAEQFSSRLRSVIIVLIGGVILVFGAVSLGRGIDASRARRKLRAETAAEAEADADADAEAEAETAAAAEAAVAAGQRVEPSDAQLDDPVKEVALARSALGDEQDRGEKRDEDLDESAVAEQREEMDESAPEEPPQDVDESAPEEPPQEVEESAPMEQPEKVDESAAAEQREELEERAPEEQHEDDDESEADDRPEAGVDGQIADEEPAAAEPHVKAMGPARGRGSDPSSGPTPGSWRRPWPDGDRRDRRTRRKARTAPPG